MTCQNDLRRRQEIRPRRLKEMGTIFDEVIALMTMMGSSLLLRHKPIFLCVCLVVLTVLTNSSYQPFKVNFKGIVQPKMKFILNESTQKVV